MAARAPRVLSDLSVHRACGWVHGTTPYGRQGCPCDPAEPWPGVDVSRAVDLCVLCARGTAGGITRWAWLGCDACRSLERELQEALGVRVLPLGRHSIQNGVTLRLGQAPAAEVSAFAVSFEGLSLSWFRLFDWGKAEALRLAATLDQGQTSVPLAEWTRLFPPSRTASVDAYERYLQMPLPDSVRAQAPHPAAGA